jgi:preprotein translocase subunit SecG
MLANVILAVHCLLAIAIIVLVLLQHGKGADMGAAFGTGSAGSLFGSSGAANFLSRSTAVCAALFFATSLGLTYFHAPKVSTGVMGGVMDGATPATAPAKADPAKDGAGTIPVPTAITPAAGSANSAPPSTVPAPATPAPAPAEPKAETKSGQIPK